MSNGTSNGTNSSNGVNGSHKDLGPVPPLPTPNLSKISNGVSLLQPLSRKGTGPGIVLLVPTLADELEDSNLAIREGIPSALIKWAEEGYAVVEIRAAAFTLNSDPFRVAIEALSKCSKCDNYEKIGLVAYDPELWTQSVSLLRVHSEFVGAVLYSCAESQSVSTKSSTPLLHHIAGKIAAKPDRTPTLITYDYPMVSSHLAFTPFSTQFSYSTESVSHTRNLSHLKPLMNGPYFDLEAIWDEHTYYEFEVRSVPHTMATMVAEPYVNHVPTLTGGIGREKLTDFYTNHFVHQNPDDTALDLISRTVGIDRVIDEFIFSFTHDRTIDWLIPGIPPTDKFVEIPFTAIVNVRGDRLYHEHIAWDQATVLRQLGLLGEFVPYYGKKEIKVPVAGKETSDKMRDKNSVESNLLFKGDIRDA